MLWQKGAQMKLFRYIAPKGDSGNRYLITANR
jgi:hypothetical protein